MDRDAAGRPWRVGVGAVPDVGVACAVGNDDHAPVLERVGRLRWVQDPALEGRVDVVRVQVLRKGLGHGRRYVHLIIYGHDTQTRIKAA